MVFEDTKIYNLYIEGAAEDMVNSSLSKLQAPEHIVQFFLQKINGKLVFKPQDVSILYSWIRDQNANTDSLKQDYLNYLKYFSNIPLQQFQSYIKWTEKVHAKRDEANFQNRHKEVKEIELEGQDKENIIADDENVLILKGDDEHKCVRYGRGYTFCISRPGGGNMFSNYRTSKSSTFYFIFFKNIPKSDPKHILVLDRTEHGYEWTFADNRTQPVKGGWEEIVEAFPVLAKYKKHLSNKPLSEEEKQLILKIQQFINNPTLNEFNTFNYSEKANVLKYGSSIPLDIFLSLDKFLRNEWVSVGPNMSVEIYKQLTPSEINRFITVRKQAILHDSSITNEFDFEYIINKDQEFKQQLQVKNIDYVKAEGDKAAAIFDETGEKTSLTIGYDEGHGEGTRIDFLDKLPNLSHLNHKIDMFMIMGGRVTDLEGLPEGVEEVRVHYNEHFNSFSGIPQSVVELQCHPARITTLEGLPKNIKSISLYDSNINTLKGSPEGVEVLEINGEYINDLRGLSQSIKIIRISNSPITSLEGLPEGIEEVCITGSKLVNFRGLPQSVKKVDFSGGNISSLEGLPKGVEIVDVSRNKLTNLRYLPQSVKHLDCSHNPLTSIEGIPATCLYNAYGVPGIEGMPGNRSYKLEHVSINTLLKTYLLMT